jgi:hypothetical protein
MYVGGTILFNVLLLTNCEEDFGSSVVPGVVSNSLTANYPDAGKISWNRKGNYYVADFNNETTGIQSWFDEQGNWLQSKTDIPVYQLNQSILDDLSKSEYVGWTVEHVSLLERKDMETVYLVQLNGEKKVNLYYCRFCNPIKKTPYQSAYMDYPVIISPEIRSRVDALFNHAGIVDLWDNSFGIQLFIHEDGYCKIAAFDSHYLWISSIWEIDRASVPAVVLNSFNTSEYGKLTVDSYKTQTNSNSVSYLIYFHIGKEAKIMRILEDGKILYILSG